MEIGRFPGEKARRARALPAADPIGCPLHQALVVQLQAWTLIGVERSAGTCLEDARRAYQKARGPIAGVARLGGGGSGSGGRAPPSTVALRWTTSTPLVKTGRSDISPRGRHALVVPLARANLAWGARERAWPPGRRCNRAPLSPALLPPPWPRPVPPDPWEGQHPRAWSSDWSSQWPLPRAPLEALWGGDGLPFFCFFSIGVGRRRSTVARSHTPLPTPPSPPSGLHRRVRVCGRPPGRQDRG